MDLFDGVLPFVYTAEHGSFTKAAEKLGVTPAAVSKAVGKLEARLGVRLLHRTTRSVVLSEEGELFWARAREAVAQLEAARARVTLARTAPEGELLVSAPFVVGRRIGNAVRVVGGDVRVRGTFTTGC